MSEIDQYKQSMQKARSELVDDLSVRDFVVFAGAGVSETAGVELWGNILKSLDNRQPREDSELQIENWPEYEYPELAQILFGRYLQNQDDNRYYDIVKECVTSTKQDCCDVQKLLVKLSGRIITTNYDDTFDKAFQKLGREFSSQALPNICCQHIDKEDSITYLHGHFPEPKVDEPEIILKTEDYAKYYSALNKGEESCVEKAISYMYTEKTEPILFHGFSFEDRFIERTLSRLCEKKLKEQNENENKQTEKPIFGSVQHYALLPFNDFDDDPLAAQRVREDEKEQEKKAALFAKEKQQNSRLDNMNITVIRYKRHKDVIHVLEDIEKKRNSREALTSEKPIC